MLKPETVRWLQWALQRGGCSRAGLARELSERDGWLNPRGKLCAASCAQENSLEQATNVCVFRNPGVGKTHLMAAVGRALVERGQPVLFVAVQALVERLVEAKRELRLARELRRLDRYACLGLDNFGYVRQDRAEMEELSVLLADRYERHSAMITSNLVFSQWNQIFHGDMTAAAAIDRVVHHSVILEQTVPSCRAEAARAGTQDEER